MLPRERQLAHIRRASGDPLNPVRFACFSAHIVGNEFKAVLRCTDAEALHVLCSRGKLLVSPGGNKGCDWPNLERVSSHDLRPGFSPRRQGQCSGSLRVPVPGVSRDVIGASA